MRCEHCNQSIDRDEANEHLGQRLCEDCYMVVLSPLKTCDPWAVHSAKSLEKHGYKQALTPLQRNILNILEASGGVEPTELVEKLKGDLTFDEVKRQFAALRHMEKVRAEKQGDQVIWRLW